MDGISTGLSRLSIRVLLASSIGVNTIGCQSTRSIAESNHISISCWLNTRQDAWPDVR